MGTQILSLLDFKISGGKKKIGDQGKKEVKVRGK